VDDAKVSALAQHSGTQSAERLTMKVEVTGAAAKIDAIFRFDKDVWAGIQKGVKDAAKEVVTDAQRRVPSFGVSGTSGSGGWGSWIAKKDGRDLSFDQGKIRKNIKPRFKSQMKSGVRVVKGQAVNMSPAGAIYMLAGSQNRSGHRFNTVIKRQHGSGPWARVMTPAYYAKGPEAAKEIGRLIEQAVNNVNRA
jgi:hypothetical protein